MQPQNHVLPSFYFFLFFLSGIFSVNILSLWRVKKDTDERGILYLLVDLLKLGETNLIFGVAAYF